MAKNKDPICSGVYDFKNKELLTRDVVLRMLRQTQVMFKWSGLPDTIPQRNLELLLQREGFAGFIENNGKFYAVGGGLGGPLDVYYEPTELVVANPALNLSRTFKLNEDVVVINSDSLRSGLMPIFKMFGSLLAENIISLRMVDLNTRIPYLISASDDNTKRSAELYLKKVVDGELAIIGENAVFEGIKTSPYSNASNRPITSLLEYHQFLRASWLNEVGIQINGNMKRETLTDDEISMAEDAIHPLVDDMLEQRRIACKKINEMFGLNVSVDFDSAWKSNRSQLEREIEMMKEPIEQIEEKDGAVGEVIDDGIERGTEELED